MDVGAGALIRPLMLAFAFLLALAGCDSSPVELKFSGQTMGTSYHITIIDRGQDLNSKLLKETIDTSLLEYNAAYSNWDPTSEVSRFNAQVSTDPIPVSDGFATMWAISAEVHERSDGQFDPTLRPLVDLWGFGPSGTVTQRPSQDAIRDAKSRIGLNDVITFDANNQSLRKRNPDASIDVSGIAKGHGIDTLTLALEALGAEHYLVEIGGDLFAKGQTARGTRWRIGIEQPSTDGRQIETLVEIADQGMATSGDYRNYFENNGIRYSHIIDAKTGSPITHTTASVTVLAETAAEADAWATALLALGAEPGMEIAEKYDLAALFMVRDKSDHTAEFTLKPTPQFLNYQVEGDS